MRELKQNWLDIFSAFRVAIDPKKMMLGFVGALVSLAVVFSLLWIFGGKTEGVSFHNGVNILSKVVTDPMSAMNRAEFMQSVRNHLSPQTIQPKDLGFLALAGIVVLLLWSYFGGAILRGSAVEFCKDDRIDLQDTMNFAGKKFSSFFWAPIVPLLGIAFFLLCIYLGGVVGRVPYGGPIVVGIFFFLALLAGFLVVLISIGTMFGAPLMGPTVATEGTDAFDAISRSFSYIYGRPWRFIWYCLVGLVYGAACVAFVALFACALLKIALCAGAYGMGKDFAPIGAFVRDGMWDETATFAQKFCAVLVKAGVIAVWGLVVGFAISMKLTVNTIIYALLRKDVDGTNMSEVYIEEEEEAPAAAEGPVNPPAEQK